MTRPHNSLRLSVRPQEVAKLGTPAGVGRRGWIKTKNCDYWRNEMEREGTSKIRRERQFV
jgi:hypothetical protein